MGLKNSLDKRTLFFRRSLRQKGLKPVNSRKVLVSQFAGLGDAALLAPYVKGLINQGYGADICTTPSLKPFWEYFIPEADILTFDQSLGFGRELEELGNEIASRDYEAAFSVSISSLSTYIAGSARTPERYGMTEDGKLYTGLKQLMEFWYDAYPDEHIKLRYQKLFSKKIKDIKPAYPAIEKKEKIFKLAIHPGAKWIPRRWPQEHFIALARILDGHNLKTAILFGPQEEEWHEAFSKEKFSENIQLINTAGMKEMFEIILSSELFLGNDSGPAHAASLAGMKTIVLWGPGNYERVRPIGDNVHILMKEISCRPCRQYIHEYKCELGDNICLKQIYPEEVMELIKRYV
ncbi:MAG: glycosyltransferase family 9 protein [Candidatus Kapaibacterium sp.]